MNTIYYVGYSATHSDKFLYNFPNAEADAYLLLLIQSPSKIWVDGEFREFSPGTALLYKPGQKICYGANGQPYKNDWLRFASDEGFVTGFPLCGVPFPVSDPEYCHSLFRLLTWESTGGSEAGEMIIESLLRALFLKLHEDSVNSFETPRSVELMQLHKQIVNRPEADWSVTAMAEQMHISTGYLQLIYKQTFGNTCMEDVIKGRIRLAKEQLIYTDKTVGEIADFCGYRNVEHFCRQFKAITKMTPGRFRKAAGSQFPTEFIQRSEEDT